jgi:hypothetical protein
MNLFKYIEGGIIRVECYIANKQKSIWQIHVIKKLNYISIAD